METWNPEKLKEQLDLGGRIFPKLFKKGCGVCRLSQPATDRLEAKNAHGLIFAKISVDDYPEMLEISGTDVLPAFFVFADKERKGQFIGFKGLKKLENFIDTSLESK